MLLERRGAQWYATVLGCGMMIAPIPKNDGAPNGPSRRQPFSRWFRYPAGFAEDLTQTLLVSVDTTRRHATVLDPFAGTATLAPPLSRSGHTFLGLEAHPLIAEIAALKAGEWPDPNCLTTVTKGVLANLPAHPSIDGEHEVVRKCFDDDVLRVLVGIRAVISNCDLSLRGWLHLAMLATLRDVSTSHVGWPYQRPDKTSQPRCEDPQRRFAERVRWIASDIEATSVGGEPERAPGRVVSGDARRPCSFDRLLPNGDRADVCITSPPYLNNYDYADATRLELYFLGRADSWESMCRYARDGMIVASTQQTGQQRAQESRRQLADTRIGSALNNIVEEIKEVQSEKARPKEYDRLVLEYFSDMLDVLLNVRTRLVEGAPMVLVLGDSALYGVHVHTPSLVAELAGDAGFDTVSLSMHRSRGHRWKNHPQRPSVELGEYVVRLRASEWEPGSTW